MTSKITLITLAMALQTTFAWSGYQYGYQTYPDTIQHSHPYGHPGAYPVPAPTVDMTQLIMSSMIDPAQNPGHHLKGRDFLKSWNERYGYNMVELGAVQENIACRTKCRRLESSPVCGDYNKIRYFNSCDAECDQVTYNTNNLRYNNKCCCSEDELSLEQGDLVCVSRNNGDTSVGTTGNTVLKLILNQCMANCLTQNGVSLAQNDDYVFPC